ncbi:transmembrane protein 223 [Scleropages formosus]|uniref:Transmembrane protein 223 n=1 Tax=Scleropages formosus TaxID=113540 RepID=A0A8C9S2I5_SCLFO|nr:transmembrane protein 223 [Scleropages formosus]
MGGLYVFFTVSACRPLALALATTRSFVRLAPAAAGLSNWAPLRTAGIHSWRQCNASSRGGHVLRSGAACRRRVHSAVSRDVVLFEHDRTAFFRLLSGFCGGQLLFWTYLAHFAYTELRDRRRGASAGERGVSVFGVSLGSSAWRYGFTVGCLAVGAAIVGFGVLFCRRSVSRVILHQGGTTVTLTMQSPLGTDKARRIKLPLTHVACHAHRLESPSFIPLRVKGHRLYFLLDKEGKLNNPKLFDITVGAYRPL